MQPVQPLLPPQLWHQRRHPQPHRPKQRSFHPYNLAGPFSHPKPPRAAAATPRLPPLDRPDKPTAPPPPVLRVLLELQRPLEHPLRRVRLRLLRRLPLRHQPQPQHQPQLQHQPQPRHQLQPQHQPQPRHQLQPQLQPRRQPQLRRPRPLPHPRRRHPPQARLFPSLIDAVDAIQSSSIE